MRYRCAAQSGKRLPVGALALLSAFMVPGAVSPARADVWTLSGVTFNDGGTANGSLSTTVYGYLATFDVTTTTINTWTGVRYSSSSGYSGSLDTAFGTELDLYQPGYDGFLHLVLQGGLNGAGPDGIDVAGGVSYECNTYQCAPGGTDPNARYITGGELVAGVPEPASITLLGVGAIGLRLARRRQTA